MRVAARPAILQHLYRKEFSAGYLSLKSLLVDAGKSVLELGEADAIAYAEANTSACWNYIFKHEAANQRRGLSPIFSPVSSHDKVIEWCPYGTDSKTNSQRKNALLRHRPALLRALDSVTDREYEIVGCVVSELIGASRVHLTPRGNEGGVDFFALLPSPSTCHVFLGNAAPLRIVGQSKNYKKAADHDHVKGFTSTLNDIFTQSPRVEKHVPAWFRATPGPIVGWLIARCGLQAGAESRAKDHGLISSNSLDVAEILALSRRLREDLPSHQRVAELRARIVDVQNRFTAGEAR
jgi:hypothetical protein